jgi:hypothetical protein
MKSDDERKSNDLKWREFVQNPRIVLMMISFLSSIGLWYFFLPPLWVSALFTVAASLFLGEILGITDSQNNKLDVVFSSPQVKVTAQLIGSIVVPSAIWMGSYYLLDGQNRQKDAELAIATGLQKQKEYVYIVRKHEGSSNENTAKTALGRFHFSTEFQELKTLEPFNPLLTQIRDECSQKDGLCAFTEEVFTVSIYNSGKLNINSVNSAYVCAGHRYLVDMTLLISPDESLLKSIKKNDDPEKKSKTYTVQVEEYYPECPPSDSPYPRLLFDVESIKQAKEKGRKITRNGFKTYYALESP